MPVMDIGHVSVLVFSAGMLVFMRVSHVCCVVHMKLVMAMPVFVDDRHMYVKMGVFLICE